MIYNIAKVNADYDKGMSGVVIYFLLQILKYSIEVYDLLISKPIHIIQTDYPDRLSSTIVILFETKEATQIISIYRNGL